MCPDANVSELGDISSPPLARRGYLNYATAQGTPAVRQGTRNWRGGGGGGAVTGAGGLGIPPTVTWRPLAAALMGPVDASLQTLSRGPGNRALADQTKCHVNGAQ